MTDTAPAADKEDSMTATTTTDPARTTAEPWLTIDIAGYAQSISGKGKHRVLAEAVSNAFDADATHITIRFHQRNGEADLTVADDDPQGFARLADAWELFAPSTRKADPTKRGRFGQGEKELIALCAAHGSLLLQSTTGTVSFGKNGRTVDRTADACRPAGSVLTARLRCTQREGLAFEWLVRRMIIPEGRIVTYNGEALHRPAPVDSFTWTLPTIIADDDGMLTRTSRATRVDLFEPAEGDRPYIFELGVPVVKHDGRFHVDVSQKVPLGRDRDNVAPSYLRAIREAILDHAADRLTTVDLKAGWVTDALPNARPEVLRTVVEGVYGKDAVIADPSNPEATKLAVDEGRTLVYGKAYRAPVWERIRAEGILRPAGQVIQTGIPTTDDPDLAVGPIDGENWTPSMTLVARYAQQVGEWLLGFTPRVEWYDADIRVHTGHAEAWYGNRTIAFNLRTLGHRWPEGVTAVALDALLIHEYSHERVADHLSAAWYTECCRLGGKLHGCPATWTAGWPNP